jgi:transcriptional regulator with XRE-family HTH domain
MPEEKGFFAARLKLLREQAQLSQPGLAECSGVAVSTIRQFEYGIREPTYGTLLKLAKGLGVSLLAFDPEGPAGVATPEPASKQRGRQPKGK